MTVHFSNREYEFNHGRKPRGHGHWAFRFGCSETPEWAPSNLSLSEAKKWARVRAKELNVQNVTVCS